MSKLNLVSEYRTWIQMRVRCRTKTNKMYKDYGGRGIKVCERWGSYKNFIEDMGPRPSPKHSLDRIDNNGDYSPENCRWTDMKAQSNNTRRNRILEHNGQKKSVAQWADHYGIHFNYIHNGIAKNKTLKEILEKQGIKDV